MFRNDNIWLYALQQLQMIRWNDCTIVGHDSGHRGDVLGFIVEWILGGPSPVWGSGNFASGNFFEMICVSEKKNTFYIPLRKKNYAINIVINNLCSPAAAGSND